MSEVNNPCRVAGFVLALQGTTKGITSEASSPSVLIIET